MSDDTAAQNLAVLDQIRDSLAETLRFVERQEQELADSQLREQGAGERTVIWHHTLDRLGDRLRDWGDQIDQALRRAAQVEQLLTEAEAQLDRARQDVGRVAGLVNDAASRYDNR